MNSFLGKVAREVDRASGDKPDCIGAVAMSGFLGLWNASRSSQSHAATASGRELLS